MGSLQDSSVYARLRHFFAHCDALTRWQRRKINKKLKQHPSDALALIAVYLAQGDQALLDALRRLDWIDRDDSY